MPGYWGSVLCRRPRRRRYAGSDKSRQDVIGHAHESHEYKRANPLNPPNPTQIALLATNDGLAGLQHTITIASSELNARHWSRQHVLQALV